MQDDSIILYLLEDPIEMGNDMSIKHIIARHELVDDVDHDIVKAWNNIHVEYKMQNKVRN